MYCIHVRIIPDDPVCAVQEHGASEHVLVCGVRGPYFPTASTTGQPEAAGILD